MPSTRKGDPFLPKTPLDAYKLVRARKVLQRAKRGRGGPTADTRLNTAALLHFTGPVDPENGDWAASSLSMSECVKGNGWEKYKTRVLAAPGVDPGDIVETTADGYEYIAFNGTAAVPFMRCFDLVLLGHYPGANLIDAIKAGGGPKVGLYFFNYETINQAPAYNPWYQSIDDVSLTYLFSSSTQNVNACNNVDQFESLGGGAACGTQNAVSGVGHTWLCDTNATGYADDYATEVATKVLARYGGARLDYILVDNVLSSPYAGVASNFIAAEYTDADYQAGQKAMLSALRTAFSAAGITAQVMGNSIPGDTYYAVSAHPNRYCEHIFHDGSDGTSTTSAYLADLKPSLRCTCTKVLSGQVKSTGANYTAGTMASFHVDRFSRYEEGPGNAKWKEVRRYVAEARAGKRTYVMAARSSSSSAKFALFTNAYLKWR